MKNYLIVTNNKFIQKDFSEDDTFALLMMDEALPKVLERCMALLDEGWELAIDPMGGYLSRPNPFHTILLKKSAFKNPEAYLRDISNLDTLLSRYWLHKEDYDFHGSREEYCDDHRAVDYSIARNSIMSIKAE